MIVAFGLGAPLLWAMHGSRRQCLLASRGAAADAPPGADVERLARRGVVALGGLATLAAAEAPARAELPNVVIRSLKRYAEPLQLAADSLVFDVLPCIQKNDWPKLREYLRPDSVGNSKAYVNIVTPVAGLMAGQGEFYDDVRQADLELEIILQYVNRTVWDDEAGKAERLLPAWDDMSASMGKVMKKANGMLQEDEALKEVTPYVLPAKEYPRTVEMYQDRCKGVYLKGECTPFTR